MGAIDYSLLSRVFTRSVVRDLASKKQNEIFSIAVENFISSPVNNTNSQNFDLLYALLKKEYRNEYYYKNTLLNKLLLGVHRPTTTTALTELPIAQAKGDFVLINGKAVVYEIKTELDNLDRLDDQISNYYKAFDHVSVLTCETYQEVLQDRLKSTPVGICLLTKAETIKQIKKPEAFRDRLDPNDIFSILRKREFEDIIKHVTGTLPRVSQFDHYEVCQNLFCEIGVDKIYGLFLNKLKERQVLNLGCFSQIPSKCRD